MDEVIRYKDLSDAKRYFLIDLYARTKSFEATKKGFENFFFPLKIDGDLVLEVTVKHKKEVEKLKDQYDNFFEDLPIANRRQRIIMYQDLHAECMRPQIVAVDKNGNAIERVDRETARKCLDSVGREMMQLEIMKLKNGNNLPPLETEEGGPPQISVKIKSYDD